MWTLPIGKLQDKSSSLLKKILAFPFHYPWRKKKIEFEEKIGCKHCFGRTLFFNIKIKLKIIYMPSMVEILDWNDTTGSEFTAKIQSVKFTINPAI